MQLTMEKSLKCNNFPGLDPGKEEGKTGESGE